MELQYLNTCRSVKTFFAQSGQCNPSLSRPFPRTFPRFLPDGPCPPTRYHSLNNIVELTLYKLGRGIFEFVFSGVLMGRVDLTAFTLPDFSWEYFLITILSASIQSEKSCPDTYPRFS